MFVMVWEISITELTENGKRYKVTKHNPDFHLSETRFFRTKEAAQKQLNEWLEDHFFL